MDHRLDAYRERVPLPRQAPVLVTAPTGSGLVIPLATAKLHCRADHADEDALITAAILAAQRHVETKTGLVLLTSSWRADFDAFPSGGALRLPIAPVQSVTSVVYRDTDGVETTLSASSYHLTSRAGDALVEAADGVAWPGTARRPDAVRVTVVAGYGVADTDAVPPPIRQAILELVADMYDRREVGKVEMRSTTRALLMPFRRWAL